MSGPLRSASRIYKSTRERSSRLSESTSVLREHEASGRELSRRHDSASAAVPTVFTPGTPFLTPEKSDSVITQGQCPYAESTTPNSLASSESAA